MIAATEPAAPVEDVHPAFAAMETELCSIDLLLLVAERPELRAPIRRLATRAYDRGRIAALQSAVEKIERL